MYGDENDIERVLREEGATEEEINEAVYEYYTLNSLEMIKKTILEDQWCCYCRKNNTDKHDNNAYYTWLENHPIYGYERYQQELRERERMMRRLQELHESGELYEYEDEEGGEYFGRMREELNRMEEDV